MMAATIKTNQQGQQVVIGTLTEVKIGQVLVAAHSYGGALRPVNVVSLGRPFTGQDGRQMVYGYLTAQAPTSRRPVTRAAYRRACVTGGNCSSFGSGRSCGGHDCDGY
jgi:hypothetical protein